MMAKRAKSIDQVLDEALRQLGRNLKWALEHPEALDPHTGRWVAIDNRKVIAVSDDMVSLHKRFAKRLGVAIHYVYPPDQGRLLLLGPA